MLAVVILLVVRYHGIHYVWPTLCPNVHVRYVQSASKGTNLSSSID